MTHVNPNGIVDMAKGKRKSTKKPHPVSYYKLSEVVQKINSGQFLINSNAERYALQDFGWGISDILYTYRNLQPKHFFKSDTSKWKPGVVVDVYKARLNGEDVYTHFYIDDTFDNLIINSFKRQ